MKHLFLTLLVTILILSGCNNQETKYCGKVIEKFRTDAGYKSRPEAHIVFYCDSLKRNIDVEVTFNCYSNTFINNNVCFNLTEYDLKR